MSCLDVNDVFDELIEENKRLNRELIFANRLLKVLLEMKYNLMDKLKDFDDGGYTVLWKSDITKFIQLEEHFNDLCKKNSVVINEEQIVNVENNNVEKVDKQTSMEFFDFDEEEEQIRVDQLMKRIDPKRKVIDEMTDENEEPAIKLPTDNQGDYEQIESHDNDHITPNGEQQDCQMDDQSNEQEQNQQGDEQDVQDNHIIIYDDNIDDHQASITEQMSKEEDQQDTELTEQQLYLPNEQIGDQQVQQDEQILLYQN